MSCDRETLRRQIAEDHGFALYKHYAECDAAAFPRLHPVALKKIRLAGSIGYMSKGRRAIAYFGFQIADRRLPHRSRTGAVRIARVGTRAWARIGSRATAMLSPGDHVNSRSGGKFGVA